MFAEVKESKIYTKIQHSFGADLGGGGFLYGGELPRISFTLEGAYGGRKHGRVFESEVKK